MAKANNKTVATKVTSEDFIKSLKVSPEQKKDIESLVKLYEKVTKKKCVMWGQIFGFGEYHYKYESGREGDSLASGFAVRANGLMIYTFIGHAKYPELLKNLGKFKSSGKSCLAIKKLSDVNLKVLEQLIKVSLVDLKKKYEVK
jgi:hypothetical protein